MSGTDGLNLVKNVSVAIGHYSSLSVEKVFFSFSPIASHVQVHVWWVWFLAVGLVIISLLCASACA